MISQQELQKMSERCELRDPRDKHCALCYYYGDAEPVACCAFCTEYPNCEMGQEIAENTCKREYDEEMAKRTKVPSMA